MVTPKKDNVIVKRLIRKGAEKYFPSALTFYCADHT